MKTWPWVRREQEARAQFRRVAERLTHRPDMARRAARAYKARLRRICEEES